MSKTTLRDWFLFEDRQNYNPIKPTTVTTHALIDRRSGALSEIGSMREEWLIRSGLVDIDRVNNVRHPADPHMFDFEPSWGDELEFDFADRFSIAKTDAYPLIVTRTHPISGQLEVELRPDFRWYHFLPITGSEFRHPLDDVVVATVTVEKHEFYKPYPRVVVHPDYLRDYLAARRYALVIGVVADRFATRASVDELEIEASEEPIAVDAVTRIWPATNVESGSAWGRSSLYWSMVVLPYDRPRPERSAWHYFGDLPRDGTTLPTFIIDPQGTRGTAKDAGLRYLYFKREVLRKYLDAPGYRVSFHMRQWGIASTPMNKSVDVGVNDEQIVTAFAPDIADLPAHDQAYWASFTVVPSGGICRELFETRMMLRPPHSPSLPEIIEEAIGHLDATFKDRFGKSLYRTTHDLLPSHRHISVGPVTENVKEFLELAKTLYAITVEDFDEKTIKHCLPPEQRPQKGEVLRSIALLERLLVSRGHESAEVRPVIDRLRALNRLRVIDAHLLSTEDVAKEFEFWGVSSPPKSRRAMWHTAVDAIANTLHEIASMIEAEPVSPSR
jgi:hypothetical protein